MPRCPRGLFSLAARWFLFIALAALPACAPTDPADRVEPVASFGSVGPSLGQLTYPRAIGLDEAAARLFIVDKTARVQRYGLDGLPQLEWRMPESERGKPVGLAVAPDGTVWVADTHYYRVIRYDAEGNELLRFGRYGEGPGEFIYPTDIAFGPDGRVYVGEYGGNDRIQVFDERGNYRFAFGSFGSAPGQFSRPQGLAFDPGSGRLYVADAVNHRISVHEADGTLVTTFGTAGKRPGELAYPYDVQVLPGGSLLVTEYGNNRVQILGPDGSPRRVFGRGGTGPGEVRYPWGAVATDSEIYILDSGNNRVQVIPLPDERPADS